MSESGSRKKGEIFCKFFHFFIQSFLKMDLIQSLIFDVNFYKLENDIAKIEASQLEKCGFQNCYNRSIESNSSHPKLYRKKKTGQYLIATRDLTLFFFITIGSVFIIHYWSILILIVSNLNRFCKIKNIRTNRYCVTTVQGL